MSFDIKYFIEQAQKYWHRPIGLVFSIPPVLFFLKLIIPDGLSFSIYGTDIDILIFLYMTSTLTILLLWCLARRTPKCKKDKIGFVVAISCSAETDELRRVEKQKIQEDLIRPLKRLIGRGRSGKVFDFVEMPENLSDKIETLDEAQKLRIKSRAHFLLYGTVRLRKLDDKMHHFFNLDGLVSHSMISAGAAGSDQTNYLKLLSNP